MKFGLEQKYLDQFYQLFQKYAEVKLVKIYGSRAIGNYKKASDIDFAVVCDATPFLLGRIQRELNELPTPYMFDVTDYNRINHAPLKEHIDQHGVQFYP